MKTASHLSCLKRVCKPLGIMLLGLLLCACKTENTVQITQNGTDVLPSADPIAETVIFETAEETSAPLPVVTPEPTPVPQPFVSFDLPGGMRLHHAFTVADVAGVYCDGRDGTYVCYGSVGETEGFFVSDAEGRVPDGASPTDRICAVPDYTPKDIPKQEGYLKLVVYVPTQSVVAFRAVGGEWLIERVMRCSSSIRDGLTPYGTYGIIEKYELKRLGGKGNYHYGQYASRFCGSILFHSAPISFDAGADISAARRMMEMDEYEKLGTPASAGCVRLTVADAKWIYDNGVIYDTRVVVSKERGPEPPAIPAVIREAPYTDENGLGWDPTDPDTENPYLLLEEYRLDGTEPSPAEREKARLTTAG